MNISINKVNEIGPKLGSYCEADHYEGLIIGADGNIYKCWEDVGLDNKKMGNLCIDHHNLHFINTKNPYYSNTLFTNEECKKCQYLPRCLGGCPRNRVKYVNGINKNMCLAEEIFLKTDLELRYQQSKKS